MALGKSCSQLHGGNQLKGCEGVACRVPPTLVLHSCWTTELPKALNLKLKSWLRVTWPNSVLLGRNTSSLHLGAPPGCHHHLHLSVCLLPLLHTCLNCSASPRMLNIGSHSLPPVSPACGATLTGAVGHPSWGAPFPLCKGRDGHAWLGAWAWLQLSPQTGGQWDSQPNSRYLVEMATYPQGLPGPSPAPLAKLQETISFCHQIMKGLKAKLIKIHLASSKHCSRAKCCYFCIM